MQHPAPVHLDTKRHATLKPYPSSELLENCCPVAPTQDAAVTKVVYCGKEVGAPYPCPDVRLPSARKEPLYSVPLPFPWVQKVKFTCLASYAAEGKAHTE